MSNAKTMKENVYTEDFADSYVGFFQLFSSKN